WRYALDPNSEGKYHLVSYPGADMPSGGIFDTGGEFPNHAIFMVVGQGVAAGCAQVERLGGEGPGAPPPPQGGRGFAPHDHARRATAAASSPRRPRRRPVAPGAPTRHRARGASRTSRNGGAGTHEISGAEIR